MKNILVCKNCETKNPFYQLNCKNCKAYLRDRIINIDFWSTLWKIIESPVAAFTNIVHSEHKNFVIVLTFLLSIKFFINSLIFTNALNSNINTLNYLLINFGLSLGYTIVIVHLFALAVTLLNNFLGNQNRYSDNITIYVYSTLPIIIGGIFLFVIEYALFGHYFLTFDPSPFLLKKTAAYTITGIEGILILWSMFLAAAATYTQTKNILYSIVTGVIFI
ncbi:MAG: DUF1282 domain-containing protein, partial [Melioribacteraceae bacterium]